MMKRIGWLAAPTLALGLVGCGDDSGLTGITGQRQAVSEKRFAKLFDIGFD